MNLVKYLKRRTSCYQRAVWKEAFTTYHRYREVWASQRYSLQLVKQCGEFYRYYIYKEDEPKVSVRNTPVFKYLWDHLKQWSLNNHCSIDSYKKAGLSHPNARKNKADVLDSFRKIEGTDLLFILLLMEEFYRDVTVTELLTSADPLSRLLGKKIVEYSDEQSF